MLTTRKKPKSDLRTYYTIFLEIGFILTLGLFLLATQVKFEGKEKQIDITTEQEVVEIEEIVQTEQQKAPPPPPRPQIPVEVPNDEIIDEQEINLDADLSLDEPLEMPEPPKQKQVQENEDEFFVVVETMPELKGGLKSLQECVKYPELARKAGIEGRVIVQFIVNEQGKVEDPKVVRGIGGGADEEALRCVEQAEFTPGRQRGEPVRVQYSLPVVFLLN